MTAIDFVKNRILKFDQIAARRERIDTLVDEANALMVQADGEKNVSAFLSYTTPAVDKLAEAKRLLDINHRQTERAGRIIKMMEIIGKKTRLIA